MTGLIFILVLLVISNGLTQPIKTSETIREPYKIDKTIFEYKVRDGGVYIAGFLDKYKEYHPTAIHKGTIYIPEEIEYKGQELKVLGIESEAFSCEKDSRNVMSEIVIFDGINVENDAFKDNGLKISIKNTP